MTSPRRIIVDQIACSFDRVGDIVGLGMFNGHRSSNYRVDRIENGRVYYVPVVAKSVQNADGTFSTVWENE